MQPKAPISTVVDRQPASHKKCVLIVDDDLELASIYQHLLETFNYEVSTAANGKVALEKILSRDVDAIICDLRMPELEGDLFYSMIETGKTISLPPFYFSYRRGGRSQISFVPQPGEVARAAQAGSPRAIAQELQRLQEM